jgi:hypothetical protein
MAIKKAASRSEPSCELPRAFSYPSDESCIFRSDRIRDAAVLAPTRGPELPLLDLAGY